MESIRNLVARALRQDGHEVLTAHDGAEALDVLVREKAPSSSCSPISACRSWTALRSRSPPPAIIPT
jgi:DNA-binding response OmpR family regulator